MLGRVVIIVIIIAFFPMAVSPRSRENSNLRQQAHGGGRCKLADSKVGAAGATVSLSAGATKCDRCIAAIKNKGCWPQGASTLYFVMVMSCHTGNAFYPCQRERVQSTLLAATGS